MNRSEMRVEVQARGFSHLSDTRVNQFLNSAYQELAVLENWPQLYGTASGAAPLTVADLRTVLSVFDTAQGTRKIEYADERDLRDSYGDVSVTGSPHHYWVDNGVIRTYPVGGTLSVRYVKTPAELDDDADEPVFPEQYHEIVVLGALRRAYQDSDNFEAAEAIRQEWAFQLEIMRGSLLDTSGDGVDWVRLVTEWL